MNYSGPEKNPFDLTKASDFSDAQILDYWADITEEHGGLLGILKPNTILPMLLLGGKGSGKTHLMRYCSASVRAINHAGCIHTAFSNDGYLGIYTRIDGLNAGRFSGKGQSEEQWSAIFSYYFELWLATNLITILQKMIIHKPTVAINEVQFGTDFKNLFDIQLEYDFSSLDNILNYISEIRKLIDFKINNSALSRRIEDIDINFSPGKLIFGIPLIISQLLPEFSNSTFLYLIDEVENLTEGQQKFLNSLIRYRSGNTTLKIGARLYGIKTYNTLGSGEPIKQNSEFERVELDGLLRDNDREYQKFVKQLIIKRLGTLNFNIPSDLRGGLDSCFQSIDKTNFYKDITDKLLQGSSISGSERPYFVRLKKQLARLIKVDQTLEIESAIDLLRVPDYPILEKLNILMFYKKMNSKTKLNDIAQECSKFSIALLSKERGRDSEYYRFYQHWDSDMLSQLFRDYQSKFPYAGLNVLIHLSQGVPRNILGILKHTYRRSLFAGENPFFGGVISIRSQTEGVIDSASWFWDDAQPDSFGTEARDAVDALANFFREVRYSDNPAECDLCSFYVQLNSLTETSRLVLEKAENWSYLIKIRHGRKNKNDKTVEAVYQLSPILAPKWGLSPNRRGTIELNTELANAIFDKTHRDNLAILMQRRLSGMMGLNFSPIEMPYQKGLFTE